MAAGRRSRAGAPTVTTHPDPTRSQPEKEPKPKAKSEPEESPIAPPKTSLILKASLIFLIPYFLLIFFHYDIDFELKKSISINALLSLAGFFVTLRLIPVLSSKVMRKNIFGFDINKKGTPLGSVKVPESMGIVVGIVFLVVVILFQFFGVSENSEWLLEYNNAALTSILFMFLLGFMDDVLDLPWRVKLLLPTIAALPLLMAYVGHTTIIIPKPLVPYVGIPMLDLGGLYKLYMLLLAVFCTNSINIHAGINGLEVGQTVVIACAILMHNVMLIGVPINPEYKQAYAFSIYLVQPFLATSLALLAYNWYPSSVFVGDTYTYFAGMTLAVVGILGHFSETLLLFFIPQILNFLLSVPQLAGIRFCPRHRLPKFDPQTGLLTGTDDGTVVNLYLRLFGRRSEQSLCIHLLVFQALCCCLSFVLRWLVAGWYK